jgi:diguanylate cyclase (GGDEF)-like protein
VKDRVIAREKLTEELTIARQEMAQKAALETALGRKIRQFLGLQHFSEELKGVSGIERTASKIVAEAMSVLGRAEECALYVVDETLQGLRLAADSVRGESSGGAGAFPGGSAFDHWPLKSSQGIIIDDTQNDYRFSSDAASHPGGLMRSVIATPLVVENRVVGVVRANSSRREAFAPDDLRLLDIFSGMGAVTLRNILLYEKMDQLATHDGLTGLYVNRYFNDRVSDEIKKAEFVKGKFSLVMIDVDHFKKYNDNFGHSAGDLVLKTIANILKYCLGPGEFAGRYGGEEFAVVLPGKDIAAATKTADKIRKAVESHVFTIRRLEGKVTVSAGVAAFPAGGRTREELVWTADKCLYKAKKGGRNKVCGAI